MKRGVRIDIQEIKRKMVPVFKRYNVVKAGIFGSIARGDAVKNSDVDVLVQFKGRRSLLDLSRLEIELEKRLGRKIEVLTYKSIHPLLRERILSEEVSVL